MLMDVMDWITVRWEKATADTARYYLVHLHQDLWGGWVLTRVWGGKLSANGQIRHTPVASREAGLQAVPTKNLVLIDSVDFF